MEYAIIDVETTGHPLNKIGMLLYFLLMEKKVREFSTGKSWSIPYNITRLTGISNDTVQNAPYFHEIAKQLLDATRDCVFVAHNVNFDFNVVKNEYKSLGYSFKRKKLCTVKLSRKILPGHKSYSLGKLCADLGIPYMEDIELKVMHSQR